jgi:hypothetical protein
MRHILLRFISIESFNPDEVWYFVDSVSNNWLNSDFFSYYLDGSTNGGKHLKTLMIMSRLPYFSHFDLLKSESNCGENSQWKQCFYNYTTKLIIDNDISQLKPWILNDTYQLALLLKAKNFQNKKIINLFYNLEGNDKDKAKLIKNTKNINNLYDFVLNFEIQFYDEKDQYTYHRFEMDKNTRLVRGLRNLNYNFIDRFDFNFLNKRNVMFIKFFDQSAAERILNTMELF